MRQQNVAHNYNTVSKNTFTSEISFNCSHWTWNNNREI